MNHYLFLSIIFIYFILLIKISISSISFIYPYSIKLSNENILVIHRYGICICNSFVTEIINNIIFFTESEQISTEAALSKITCASEKGYIFCIINDKIYVFDENGNLLSQNFTKILSNGETTDYYTLVPIAKETNAYYYIIGYINNRSLNLILYCYNYLNKENEIVISEKNLYHEYYKSSNGVRTYMASFYIENKGLSCQYMKHKDLVEEVLICFFLITHNDIYYIVADYFYLPKNSLNSLSSISLDTNFYSDYFNWIGEAQCLQSVVNDDRSKSLLCYYIPNGQGRCYIFDIYNPNADSFHYWSTYYCKDAYYGLKVSYYNETDEYIFSCITDEGGIAIQFFDNNFNNYDELIKNTGCDIYGYSIIYSKYKKNYYLLSDLNCNDKEYLFEPLIYKEEKEKEKEEEK